MSPTSIGINLRVTGHCSQGGRKYMEDFFSVAYQQSEDEKDLVYAFFGIYDGHGGSEAATFAKEHLMNAIVNQKLFWSDCDQDVLRAIREGYIATHYAMWREQEKWPKTATGLPSTAGTTASVAFIRRGKIYIGHVGDSGIVLGYQEEGEKCWRAKPLTHDHKPECNVEKARIINSGGKVVTKSGVPRVVWNRPRIGHKGPVRRSTPIDEIPFLAVARSLGDLWSYNSALNEFVVSPDPDVKVVKIDPKTYRCLIFGTDGLWNVLTPSDAVDVARDAELINERLAFIGDGGEWTNPSKCLVEKALDRWNIRKMRADNTSVVTIMLDPPGPPKKETILRNCPTASYGLEYIQMEGVNEHCRGDYVNGFTHGLPPGHSHSGMSLYDQEMRDQQPPSQEMLDKYMMPPGGYAVMTRYENNYDSNYLYYDNHNNEMMSSTTTSTSSTTHVQSSSSAAIQSEPIVASSLAHDMQYMNSFAESYNSLLISNYENDSNSENSPAGSSANSSSSPNDASDLEARNDYHSYHSLDETGLAGHDHVHHHQPNIYNQQQQHLYQQQCMSAEEGYSLTKLETRGEQQYNTIQSYRQQNVSFQEFGEENSYNQYDNISSSYQQSIIVSPSHAHVSQYDDCAMVDGEKVDNVPLIGPQNVISKYYEEGSYYEPNLILSQDSNKSWMGSEDVHQSVENRLILDESIQINEISSSVVEPTTPNNSEDEKSRDGGTSPDTRVSSINSISSISSISSINLGEKEKEKDTAPPKAQPSQPVKSTTSKYKTNQKSFASEQNENISGITERRLLRSSVDYNKRTLRSRNSLSKDMKARSPPQAVQQLRRSAIGSQITTTTYSKLRSRQQEVTIWQPRQNRKSSKHPASNKPQRCDSFSSKADFKLKQSIVCSKPKTSSVSLSSSNKPSSSPSSSSSTTSLTCSSIATSSVSSTTMSKKSTSSRNSAWCPGKNAVQTRKRVQKRLSH